MHIYLNENNAEETLPIVLEKMKNKVAQESRNKAFEDCTNFWQNYYKREIQDILRDNCPKEAKLSRIRQLFNIEYSEE